MLNQQHPTANTDGTNTAIDAYAELAALRSQIDDALAHLFERRIAVAVERAGGAPAPRDPDFALDPEDPETLFLVQTTHDLSLAARAATRRAHDAYVGAVEADPRAARAEALLDAIGGAETLDAAEALGQLEACAGALGISGEVRS